MVSFILLMAMTFFYRKIFLLVESLLIGIMSKIDFCRVNGIRYCLIKGLSLQLGILFVQIVMAIAGK